MSYNLERKKLCRRLLAGGAACLMGIMMFSCTDKYDLDEEQPSDYNTIYTYLEDKGNFSTYLRLIKDLGQEEYLSRTGSITLFIANDETFGKFFQSNKWGVNSYDELSLSQKKLLLNTSMIGNVYPISMLSSVSAENTTLKGLAIRHYTSMSLTDSVQIVKIESGDSPELPTNEHWDVIKANRTELPLYKDASGTPTLLVFTPQFFDTNRLPYTDMDFIFRQPEGTLQAELNRNESGTYVNGAHIIASQFCKNGYVHEIDRVITPLENMAEVIRKNSNTRAFSSLLEMFAAPYYDRTVTNDYNTTFGTDYDSIFVKRYFSARSANSSKENSNPFYEDAYQQGMTESAVLPYDPGWTRYMAGGVSKSSDATKEDMAVMLVPTDDAMMKWWNTGSGQDLRKDLANMPVANSVDELITSLAQVPIKLIQSLLNINMRARFTGTLPSRFSAVMDDDSKEPIGIEKEHIDDIDLASNGLIYYTNTVFTPFEFKSVNYPVKINPELSMIGNAIENDDYNAFLTSSVSYYHLLLPSNTALMNYIDPVSYGKKQRQLFEFNIDTKQSDPKKRLYIRVFDINLNDDGSYSKTSDRVATTIGDKGGGLNNARLLYCVEDVMDNIIALGDLEPNRHYYPTKGNTFVYLDVENGVKANDETLMSVAGSMQTQAGRTIPVVQYYNKSREANGGDGQGNGYSYVINEAPMSTWKSVVDVLREHDEFSVFADLVEASGSTAFKVAAPSNDFYSASQNENKVSEKVENGSGNLVAHSLDTKLNDKTFQLLSAFHYTVYAPTNTAMAEAFAAGLPSAADIEQARLDDEANEVVPEDVGSKTYKLQSIVRDFVRYHVQSNSIYMDNGFQSGTYESTRNMVMLQDTIMTDEVTGVETHTYKDKNENGYFDCLTGPAYTIKVNSVSSSGINITDAMGNAQTIGPRADGLYNLQAREIWLGNGNAGVTSVESAQNIVNSSSAVIHAIDKPLYFHYPATKTITIDDEEVPLDQFHYVPCEIVIEE